MIFTGKLFTEVMEGRKTQTRRLVKEGDYTQGNTSAVFRGDRLKWMTGRTYAIQPGRSKKSQGRFTITMIRREPVQSLTEKDAEAETPMAVIGFRRSYWGAFRELWDQLHTKKGERWKDNPEVWVLEFLPFKDYPA